MVRGDVLDPAAVEKDVNGHDAVLCAIGTGAGRSTLREEGTRNIVRAMENNKGNLSDVARQLGIGRSTLYRKLEQYGLREKK